MKIKNLPSSKNTIKKVKRQATDQKIMFVNHKQNDLQITYLIKDVYLQNVNNSQNVI